MNKIILILTTLTLSSGVFSQFVEGPSWGCDFETNCELERHYDFNDYKERFDRETYKGVPHSYYQ